MFWFEKNNYLFILLLLLFYIFYFCFVLFIYLFIWAYYFDYYFFFLSIITAPFLFYVSHSSLIKKNIKRKKKKKNREKGKGKEKGNVKPLFCQTQACYAIMVLYWERSVAWS